ncbi:40S ribosomal protein S30, putative [Ricinus communis]|uniref:40S ribosomal protein S30, putative n=1 Tax=Ricinus communis TaxID=3988 RepID=B9RC07_RICCO|nr:40S ribosomal protein S30, putative [Ricinus communis]
MGKVHGSLARAGKVRGQTPKVAKQDKKKKKPGGRAHKRIKHAFPQWLKIKASTAATKTIQQVTKRQMSQQQRKRTPTEHMLPPYSLTEVSSNLVPMLSLARQLEIIVKAKETSFQILLRSELCNCAPVIGKPS